MDDDCGCEFCSPEPQPTPAPWGRTGDQKHDPGSLWMAESQSEPQPESDETPTLTLIPLITPR